MKKWTLFLSVYLCLCLLAACGAAPAGGGAVPGGAPSGEPQTGGETARPGEVTETFRIVDTEDGAVSLLLAEVDGEAVLRLGKVDVEVLLDGAPAAAADVLFRPGALLDVTHDGAVLESFPAQFANVTGLNLRSDGFDDRCRLYLDVLEDLWDVDPGLSSDVTELGVDLSQTSLSQSEQAAVAWAFGESHGIAPVQGTWEELADQGYIDRDNLIWDEGCLFSVTEKPGEGTDSLTAAFDAQKWRSGLGAYYFVDCTATQAADGAWSDYTVGAQAIS